MNPHNQVTMKNYRERLYGTYRSNFKGLQQGSETAPGRFAKYFELNFSQHLAGLSPDARIVDLGCGSGGLVAALLNLGYTRVVGVDVSHEQVSAGRGANLPLEQGDVFEFLRGQDSSVEVAFAIDLVEHLNRDELFEFANLVLGSLKEGGRLVIRTPNGKSPFALRNIYGDLTHETILSDESARQWLHAAGFSKVLVLDPVPAGLKLGDKFRLLCRWSLMKLVRMAYFVVLGRQEDCLSDNIIIVAVKGKS